MKDRSKQNETSQKDISPISQMIDIKDEAGETKMLLNIENFLFIQSADNYVEINYLDADLPQKELIRNSLKNVEEMLNNSPIIRCHRSYMLNTQKIESAKKNNSRF